MRKKIRAATLNLEMADVPEIVGIAIKAVPDEVCIVPEKRKELTTEGGLDVAGKRKSLSKTIKKLSETGIGVSLFIDPDKKQIDAALDVGAPMIELHTGTYCDAQPERAEQELKRLITAAEYAHSKGLQVNAGHGINFKNISGILEIPHLHTLNIGHSIISYAIMVGIKEAVKEMIKAMKRYKG
jgi:pyridoxine 5-phosphate synthase